MHGAAEEEDAAPPRPLPVVQLASHLSDEYDEFGRTVEPAPAASAPPQPRRLPSVAEASVAPPAERSRRSTSRRPTAPPPPEGGQSTFKLSLGELTETSLSTKLKEEAAAKGRAEGPTAPLRRSLTRSGGPLRVGQRVSIRWRKVGRRDVCGWYPGRVSEADWRLGPRASELVFCFRVEYDDGDASWHWYDTDDVVALEA